MLRNRLLLPLCLFAGVASSALSQVPPPVSPSKEVAVTQSATAPSTPPAQKGGVPHWLKPETPAERRSRLGTVDDPGPDPDPKKHYWRYGKPVHIERYDMKWAKFDQPFGMVRPFAFANIPFELYQQNDDYVWVWVYDPEAADSTPEVVPAPAEPAKKYTDYAIKFYEQQVKPEFRVIDPPASGKVVRFEEASEGLPDSGSWRNSLTVADMNEDGFMDIIAPPQRGVSSTQMPTIFLGDGKGHWKGWEASVWPHGLNYGSVVAADFNKDGHMDLAFGAHLTGVFVFLGNGKGTFTEVTEGLARDFATRRIRVADLNNDGWPDIVAITEGPSVQDQHVVNYGAAVAFINRKGGTKFEQTNIVQPGVTTGGDWLSLGDFNGDTYPDVALSSINFGSWDVLYMSSMKKNFLTWHNFDENNEGNVIPSLSYFFGNAAGRFSSATRDDAILSYIRFWLQDIPVKPPPQDRFTSIDRFSSGKDGKVRRTPIARWLGGDELHGLATGDFNHDGKLDLIYLRSSPLEAIILFGDGKGGFTRARVEGLPLARQTFYDVLVADLNGDGLPDVVVGYEADEQKNAFAKKNGSIHVFLNRGVVPEPAAAAK